MRRQRPPSLFMVFLWLTFVWNQVDAHTPDTQDESTGPLSVTLSAETSFKKDLKCHTEMVCRVEADSNVLKRLLNIVMLEKTNRTELKKVSGIYHFMSKIATSSDPTKIETPEGVAVHNASLIVHTGLPDETDTAEGQFVCKLRYFDSDFGIKSVETDQLEESSDRVCKKPALLNKLEQIEEKMSKTSSDVSNKLSDVESKLAGLMSDVSDLKNHFGPNFNDCDSLRSDGKSTSIPSRQIVTWPDGTRVLCDTQTSGGGWTVFQRRLDGSVDFYRGWKEYENGFGDLNGDFWLGLKPLQRLLESGNYELRVDMKFNGSDYYALYRQFKLSPPSSNYKLTVGGYSGTAGDSLSNHGSLPFSTFDRDNDKDGRNCAQLYHGAWWYKSCHLSNLNGLWGSTVPGKSLNWVKLTAYNKSVTRSEMKVRRIKKSK